MLKLSRDDWDGLARREAYIEIGNLFKFHRVSISQLIKLFNHRIEPWCCKCKGCESCEYIKGAYNHHVIRLPPLSVNILWSFQLFSFACNQSWSFLTFRDVKRRLKSQIEDNSLMFNGKLSLRVLKAWLTKGRMMSLLKGFYDFIVDGNILRDVLMSKEWFECQTFYLEDAFGCLIDFPIPSKDLCVYI